MNRHRWLPWIPALFLLAFSACGRKSEIASVERTIPLHPETPLMLTVNKKGELQIGDRWYHLISQEGMCQSYLERQAKDYLQMFKDYRLDLVSVHEGSRTLQVMPARVVIEFEPGTKSGYVFRLQRYCKGHGFWFFTVNKMDVDQPAG